VVGRFYVFIRVKPVRGTDIYYSAATSPLNWTHRACLQSINRLQRRSA